MPPLAAVVAKPRTGAAIDGLEAEGVYDDARRVREHDDATVELPVTEPPAETPVRDVIEQADPVPRVTGLDDLLRERGWTDAEIERAPGSWAVVGDVVLVRVPGDCPHPAELGAALLDLQGADTVLARRGIDGAHREPDVAVLAGADDTETVHVEHGTEYALDPADVMFSPGNKAERVRMGGVVREGERVLDMFAGIGYFALPMARAGARVTAVERNPVAFGYLLENVERNGVVERVRPVRADCRDVAAAYGGFERVVMGYYDAHVYLDAALPALEPGGVLHLHEATPNAHGFDRPVARLRAAASRPVEVIDRRTVKTHAAGVSHLVVDARIG